MNSSLDTPAPGSLPKRVTAIVAGILLSLMLLLAISGDFSQTSSTSAATDLATISQTSSTSAVTDLATGKKKGKQGKKKDDSDDEEPVVKQETKPPISPPTEADDWNCTNVMDWNFFDASVTQNNLGGLGPNLSDKQEIRYSGVYTKGSAKADLKVTVDKSYGSYQVKTTAHNGLNGQFGVINIKGNTGSQFLFQLVLQGTDTPIDVGTDDKILFSVFDLDSGKKPNQHEYVQFTTEVASHSVTNPTTVEVSGEGSDGTLYAQSGRYGTGADNPANPLDMSEIAEESKISVTYVGKSSWKIVFGDHLDFGGRNILFAGRSQGDCACTGVSDWKLEGNLQYNNLGGKGPVTTDPPVLRYTKVFETGLDKQAVDLVIKVADGSSYDPANTAFNGLWPTITPDHQQMAQVNVRCGSETTFEFSFVNSGTDTLAALSNTFFSVYDFDQPKKGGHEYAIFKTPPSAWKLMPDTQVLVNGSIADGNLQFTSTEWGQLSDNPTDPNALTLLQKSRSVTVWYSSASTFQVTLGSSTISEFGRNFLFAGPGIYCQAK